MLEQWEDRRDNGFADILRSVLHNLRSASQLMLPRGCVQEPVSLTVMEQREISRKQLPP